MLSLKNLSKDYYIGKERIPILKEINLTIDRGEFVSIVGPSGCGKTTLLNLLSGMDKASSGTIEFQGKSIEKNKDRQWSDWRRNQIGYIFQNFNLIEFMTASQNIEIVLQANGVGRIKRRERAKELLEKVGLSDRGRHLPSQLSGGQKQRVAIARALANRPAILLADEPTGAMDTATSREIMNLLHTLNKEEKVTILMVTHDEGLADQTDRKIRMLDGRIIADEKRNQVMPACQEAIKRKRRLAPCTALFIAAKNMLTKKKRTLLTSLGTAIGIAGVLLVFGIGSGAKERIMKEFDTIVNTRVVDVRETEVKLDEAMQAELLEDQRILDIYPSYVPEVFCQFEGKVGAGLVHSMGPMKNVKNYWQERLMYGRMPANDSSEEAIITLTLAEGLAGEGKAESILGQKLEMAFLAGSSSQLSEMATREVEIVGISGKAFLGVTDVVYIPYQLAEQVVRESLQNENYRSGAYGVTVKDVEDAVKIKDKLNELGLEASIDTEELGSIGMVLDLVIAVIMLLAGISLIVSGIMIALVSYMGVTERVREIGILRAVGFSAQNIKHIFLTEGATLGFFAGMIGVGVSTVMGELINKLVGLFFSEIAFTLYRVNGGQIVFCIFFSLSIGLLCTYAPARKASRMEPVKALGYVQ